MQTIWALEAVGSEAAQEVGLKAPSSEGLFKITSGVGPHSLPQNSRSADVAST